MQVHNKGKYSLKITCQLHDWNETNYVHKRVCQYEDEDIYKEPLEKS